MINTTNIPINFRCGKNVAPRRAVRYSIPTFRKSRKL